MLIEMEILRRISPIYSVSVFLKLEEPLRKSYLFSNTHQSMAIYREEDRVYILVALLRNLHLDLR